MVSYTEMKILAEIKERNQAVKEQATDAFNRLLSSSVERNLCHSVIGQTETIQWLIGLFERELKLPFTKVDINIAEHMEMIQRGMLKRNNG